MSKTYTYSVEVTCNFTVDIEAASAEEAMAIATRRGAADLLSSKSDGPWIEDAKAEEDLKT